MANWKLLLTLCPVVAVIDLVWLGVVMKGFYRDELGELARRTDSGMAPRWGAAVLIYLLIPLGLVLFVRPRFEPGASIVQAFVWGALFGLVLYGVYDLTNRAVLERWSIRLVLVDIAWGCVLCGISSALMRWIEAAG